MSFRAAVKNRALQSSREELAEVIAHCASLRHTDPAQVLQLALNVSERAEREGFRDLQARALLHCASALYQLGRRDTSPSYLQRAEEILSVSGSPADRAYLHYQWGVYYKESGDLMPAFEHLSRALRFCGTPGSLSLNCAALNTLGLVFARVGAYDTALRYYFRSLELAEGDGLEPVRGALFSNIGSAYYQLGDNDGALDYYRQALSVGIALNHRTAVGRNSKNIAVIYQLQQNYPQALEYFRRALEIWREIGNKTKEADVLTNIGMVYAHSGDPDCGLALTKQALECLRGLQNTWEYAVILSNLGWLYRKRREYHRALVVLRRALQLFGKLGMSRYENEVRRLIADLYEESGDYRNSLEYNRHYLSVRDELQGAGMQRSVAELEVGRTLRKAERKQEALQRQAEQARREVEARMKELNALTVGLTERNEMLRKIRDDIRPLLCAADEKTRKSAGRIVRQIDGVVAEEQRSLFQEQFERVYQEFIRRLRAVCADLTPAEIRTCVLLKLGLSNKQIAEILFTSPLTVKTHRAHIRRKLGLGRKESLPGLLFAM